MNIEGPATDLIEKVGLDDVGIEEGDDYVWRVPLPLEVRALVLCFQSEK
jgi:hypothetical protein